MSKNIKLAKHAGFCYGVKRAVETVKRLKEEQPDKEIFVLGELIHNSQVIEELEKLGIKTVNELPNKSNNSICVIRSHGASPEIFDEITQAGFALVDLTCPDVKKVQQKAIELVKEDYYLVIVGKSEHPEVMAIKANAERFGDKVVVASEVDQLVPLKDEIKTHKRVGVVVQTTQRLETLTAIIDYLTSISKELHIANTICASTSLRQNEAKSLAQESDLMVVVGSKKSANTTHLAEILKDVSQTIHIEDANELKNYKEIVETAQNISITAGASTPQQVIENVMNKLQGG